MLYTYIQTQQVLHRIKVLFILFLLGAQLESSDWHQLTADHQRIVHVGRSSALPRYTQLSESIFAHNVPLESA